MNAAAATPASTNVAGWIRPVISRLRKANTNHSGTNSMAPKGTANTAEITAAFNVAISMTR